MPPPTTTTFTRDARRDLDLDQHPRHREPRHDRRAHRPRRREVLGPDPVPGVEVRRVEQVALDAQDVLGAGSGLGERGDDLVEHVRACSSKSSDTTSSVAGSIGARPDRKSRSPQRTALEMRGSCRRPGALRRRSRSGSENRSYGMQGPRRRFRIGVTRDVRRPDGTLSFAPFDLEPLDRAGVAWSFLDDDAPDRRTRSRRRRPVPLLRPVMDPGRSKASSGWR